MSNVRLTLKLGSFEVSLEASIEYVTLFVTTLKMLLGV